MVPQFNFILNLLFAIIWIPIILFYYPSGLILYFYNKAFEQLVTKCLQRNFRPMNNVADSLNCLGDSYSLPNTNSAKLWVVSGKWITAEEFSSHFRSCFLEGNSDKYKNLYAHVTTYGTYSFYAHCKPEELDLKWHIREYCISDFGHQDGNDPPESFCSVWMTTNTYEEGRPPWQFAILHLGDAESGTMETGIVAKFSHALLDGYAVIHMIEKLMENPAPYLVKNRTFTWMSKLKLLYDSPRDLLNLGGKMTFSRNCKIPLPKINQRPSSKRDRQHSTWFMSLTTLDMNTVKMIRKSADTPFICLMVSAQCGAIRKLLLETFPEAELPEFLWISSSMPWPNHPHSLTNHYTNGFLKCPLRMGDPLKRLKWLEANYRDFKKAELDVKAACFGFPLVRMLPTWARRFILHYCLGMQNISILSASLMLSEKEHYLLGRKVKNLYLPLICPDILPSAVLYGITTSHSGQIDVSISASNSIVRNKEELNRLTQVYFVEELDSLGALYGLKSSCRHPML